MWLVTLKVFRKRAEFFWLCLGYWLLLIRCAKSFGCIIFLGRAERFLVTWRLCFGSCWAGFGQRCRWQRGRRWRKQCFYKVCRWEVNCFLGKWLLGAWWWIWGIWLCGFVEIWRICQNLRICHWFVRSFWQIFLSWSYCNLRRWCISGILTFRENFDPNHPPGLFIEGLRGPCHWIRSRLCWNQWLIVRFRFPFRVKLKWHTRF